MSVIDQAKEIAGLIKKIGDIELYRKIIELEGEIIELTRSKHELEDTKSNLEKQLALKKKHEFRSSVLFSRERSCSLLFKMLGKRESTCSHERLPCSRTNFFRMHGLLCKI